MGSADADPGGLQSHAGRPIVRTSRRWGCGNAPYSTIGAALAAANPGATVVVCPGTYTEDAVITKPVTLIGQNATINATGLAGAPIGSILGQAPYNGVTIEASNVTVKGFTVEGAEGEGILAINPDPVAGPVVQGRQLYTGTPITHVTIEDNNVTGNDLGFGLDTSPYAFCTPTGGSDCGEGIHLLSVAYSSVIDNQSVGNAGGILLTDEFGGRSRYAGAKVAMIDGTLDTTAISPAKPVQPPRGQGPSHHRSGRRCPRPVQRCRPGRRGRPRVAEVGRLPGHEEEAATAQAGGVRGPCRLRTGRRNSSGGPGPLPSPGGEPGPYGHAATHRRRTVPVGPAGSRPSPPCPTGQRLSRSLAIWVTWISSVPP